jgi:hypothetical protein
MVCKFNSTDSLVNAFRKLRLAWAREEILPPAQLALRAA